MKAIKYWLALVVVVAGVVALTGQAQALSFVLGDQKFFFDGVSRFEDPVPPGGGIVPATGNLWGVSQVTSIMRESVLGSGLYDITVYSKPVAVTPTAEFLTLRYGGLDLHYDGNVVTGYHVTDAFGVPVPTITLPHQSYFVDDTQPIPASSSDPGPRTGLSYAQIYSNIGVDPFATDVFTVGAVPGGAGAVGTFGTTMGVGTLALDMQFAAGAIWVDEMTNAGFAAADQQDIFRALITSNTQNATLGYLDIIGGTWQSTFDSNGFYTGSTYLSALGRTDGFDVRIEASNSSATPIPLSPAMIAAGWNARNESSSALTTVVPEPGTMLLFGSGLVGLARLVRRKVGKK